MACARLYNYIITMDGPNDTMVQVVADGEDVEFTIDAHPDAPLGMSYLPVIPNEDWGEFEGISYTRLGLVEYLRNNGIMRPLYNLERKQREVSATDSDNIDNEWDEEFISPS